ncbi:MAG TPA: transcription antitermination factor NusB [Gelria sp.]|nr:transcription antitermination factor NusB [Gelria sp.]
MSRRKAREFAFKVLFQVDQVNADPRCAFQYLLQEDTLAEKDWDFSWDLIAGSLDHLEQIDTEIGSYIRDWSINRLSAIDRNIIRVAGYEILFYEHSQPVVAIDEALEIAKKYGDDNSVAFINAILDKMLGESK